MVKNTNNRVLSSGRLMTFHLEADHIRWLDQVAERRGSNRSAVLRGIIQNAMAGDLPGLP